MAPRPADPNEPLPEKGLFEWFDELDPLSAEAREPILRRLAETEPQRAAELRAMLDVNSKLPSIGVPPGLCLERDVNAELPAGLILASRYRILRKLDEGGQGVVYLAEQIQGVSRRVAIKVLRAGRTDPAQVERFLAEQQLLASMQHPHIPALFDSGETDSGDRFFAMEYVEGRHLTDYADERRLSVEQRLRLFQQLCCAVSHMHHKLKVHRDLKPKNVMVVEDPATGAPSVKLLDFGIAVSLGGAPTGDRPRPSTSPGAAIGTPVYMSPEQAKGRSEPEVGWDIYALGAILYQLLTGTTPFTKEQLREARRNGIWKFLAENDPPTASIRLQTDFTRAPDRLRRVAEQRCLKLSQLVAALQSDLDATLGKALQRDVKDRYASVEEMSNDVSNYIEHRPLQAWKDQRGTFYRARKFARRNRGKLIVAASVAALSVAAVVAIVDQRDKARVERDRADVQRKAAESANSMLVEANDKLEYNA